MTNLPVRTLHYYDQINLFKPAYVDPQTNYRYYDESQIYQLDLIKSLKYIGTLLKSIKLTLAQLLEFLTEQEEIVEKKVQPMAITIYLLIRFEGKIDKLREPIDSLSDKLTNL